MDEIKKEQLLKNFEKRRKTINDELSRIKKLLLDKDVHEISFTIFLEMKPKEVDHWFFRNDDRDKTTQVTFIEKVEKHFTK